MAWPFPRKDEPPVDPEKKVTPDPAKPPEKTPAELIADALKPFNERFTALDAKLEAMKPAPPKPKPVENMEIPSVLDDENAAFNVRMTPIVQRQLELEAKISRSEVKQEYFDIGFGPLWTAHEKEIDATLAGTALVTPDGQGGVKAMRGDPQYVRNVVDMILGRAARQGGVKFDQTKNTFFLEGADGSASTVDPKVDTSGLTPKQIKVFQRMGVSLEDAKRAVSKLEFVS